MKKIFPLSLLSVVVFGILSAPVKADLINPVIPVTPSNVITPIVIVVIAGAVVLIIAAVAIVGLILLRRNRKKKK